MEEIVNNKIDDEEIRKLANYALESGRRFRPLLFILAYKIFQPDLNNKIYQASAAIELLHKASLVHDDYLDRDKYRRGKTTFCYQYGDRMAVIVGDLLVSLAFEEFLDATKNPYLIKEWSKLYRLLTIGEIKDLLWEGNWEIETDKLQSMIYGKTASFLEFVMKAGSYLATTDLSIATQMGQFGLEIGFAFQIMNDFNNWYGIEKELGRTPKGDIQSGKVNLVTQIVQKYQKTIKDPNELTSQIIVEVQNLALVHIKNAQEVIDNIDVKNKYTKVLERLLKEFDQKWFWVDRDDQ